MDKRPGYHRKERKRRVVYSYAPFIRWHTNPRNKPITCGKIYPVEKYEEYGIMSEDWRYWHRDDKGDLIAAEWGDDVDVAHTEQEFIERDRQDAKREEREAYLRQQQAQEGTPC